MFGPFLRLTIRSESTSSHVEFCEKRGGSVASDIGVRGFHTSSRVRENRYLNREALSDSPTEKDWTAMLGLKYGAGTLTPAMCGGQKTGDNDQELGIVLELCQNCGVGTSLLIPLNYRGKTHQSSWHTSLGSQKQHK